MAITADNIRALSGLSAAELSDSLIAASLVLDKVELDRQVAYETPIDIDDATTTEEKLAAYEQHDYRCWKAVVILTPAILTTIPETVKDNFNQYTRFGSFHKMLDFAASFVESVEEGEGAVTSLLTVVVPDLDPVTGG